MYKNKAFTLVEILVIIVVIGILSTIVIVAVGNWRKSTAETEVNNDLTNLANAMNSERNFNDGYPYAIPPSFTASPDVTVTYAWGSAIDYCVQAESKVITSVVYHIEAPIDNAPQSGPC